jgi:hypothetical protein
VKVKVNMGRIFSQALFSKLGQYVNVLLNLNARETKSLIDVLKAMEVF